MVALSATTRYFYLFPAGCKCLHPPSGSYLWRCCPGTAERGSSSYFYRTQRNWTGSDPASNDHYNTHTYTGAWGGVTVVTIITPITVSAWGTIFIHAINSKLWLIYDRLSNSDIKKESSETISSHLIGVCVMPTLADTTVLSLSWQSLLDKSWIKYRFIPLCSVV